MCVLTDSLVQLRWRDDGYDSEPSLQLPWEQPLRSLKQQMKRWGKQVDAPEKR